MLSAIEGFTEPHLHIVVTIKYDLCDNCKLSNITKLFPTSLNLTHETSYLHNLRTICGYFLPMPAISFVPSEHDYIKKLLSLMFSTLFAHQTLALW